MSQLSLHAACPKQAGSDGPVVPATAPSVWNVGAAASTSLRQHDGACGEGQALGDLRGEDDSDKEGNTKRMSRHHSTGRQGDDSTSPRPFPH